MGGGNGNVMIAVGNGNRRRRNGRQDGGAITMRDIEIAVDGSGGDGRRRHNGW